MKFGLLIIGNEILDGKITDLNTRFLSEFLRTNHLELHVMMTVKDNEASIHQGLKTLADRCEVIVTSGGLGPTLDDITKQTIASYVGSKIMFSDAAMRVAEKNYSRFQRPFPGKEHGYCFLPEGFIPLDNSTGFAPGFFIHHENKCIFSAPGVPREFKVMTEEHLLRLVNPPEGSGLLESLNFRTRKVPEEKIFGEVDKDLWKKLSQFGDVSSLPILFGVDIGVKIRASNQKELDEKRTAVTKVMKDSPVWENVWHVGYESVEEMIVRTANAKKIKYGFSESCTGGLCSHRMTNISGASTSFMGSVVSYDNSVKENILGVSSQSLKDFGAVSVEVAKEMANGLRMNLGLDIVISVTGIAGPGGGSTEKPVGTVCIGYSTAKSTEAVRLQFYGDRELLKNRFSQAALFTLLEQLENFAGV